MLTFKQHIFELKGDEPINIDNYDDRTIKKYNVYAHKKYFNYKGVQSIPISSLIKTQNKYFNNIVSDYLEGKKTPWVDKLNPKEPIDVISHQGKNYICDGHHRVMANVKLGNDNINAHVYETNKKFKPGK